MKKIESKNVKVNKFVLSKIFFINHNLKYKNSLLGRIYNVKIGKNRTYFKFNHILIEVKIYLIVK